jgi:hypothetical protein
VVSTAISSISRRRRAATLASPEPIAAASSRPARPRLCRPRPTPTTAAPTQPPRSGWLARWFGLQPRAAAPLPRPARLDHDAPFTPENHPGLTAEQCAILNTRIEDCSPELLRLIFGSFAHLVAQALADAGHPEAEAIFATISDRLSGILGDARPETPPPLPADPAAAIASAPHSHATPAAPPGQAEPTAPAPAPAASTPAIRAPQTGLATAPHPQSGTRERPWLRDSDPAWLASRPPPRAPRPRTNSDRRLRRRIRTRMRRLPAPRPCYAACAGPP